MDEVEQALASKTFAILTSEKTYIVLNMDNGWYHIIWPFQPRKVGVWSISDMRRYLGHIWTIVRIQQEKRMEL